MVVLAFVATVAVVFALLTAVQIMRGDGSPSVAEQVAANLRAVREPATAPAREPVEGGVSRPGPARVAAAAAGAAGLHVGKHVAIGMARGGLLTARVGGKVGVALLRAALKK